MFAQQTTFPTLRVSTLVALHQTAAALTNRLAFVGVVGMLAIGVLVTIDILVFRAALNSPLLGFVEVLQTVFAVAVASVFAAGLAARTNLRIDVLARLLGKRAERWLEILSATALLACFMLLAWESGIKSIQAWRIHSQTVLLELPVYAFYWGITAFLALCIPVQIIVLLNSLAAALLGRNLPLGPDDETPVPRLGLALALVTVIALATGFCAMELTEAASDFSRSNPAIAALGVVAILWVLVLLSVPVSVSLLFSGLIGCALLFGWDRAFLVAGAETIKLLTNPELSLIPLFLMMGAFATTSGMSADIYRLAQAAFGSRRGGLAIATITGCAGFGALTGSSIATAATIGSVAMPEMRARGYSPRLATGCIAAGATLGQLVPPSTIIVLYAILVEESIGKLYIAILGPAFLSILLYVAAIMIMVRMQPQLAPGRERFAVGELIKALSRSLMVLFLFTLVIGGIYTGIFTATEAAAVGVVITFLGALMRGKLKGKAIWNVAGETTRSVAMLYLLIIGALVMSFFMALSGLPDFLIGTIGALDLPPLAILSILIVLYIFLGTIMDATAVMIITAGVVAPLVVSLGYDPIWWGVMMVVLVEIGVVTPPFGINLFVLKSVEHDVKLSDIYKGVMPFVAADLIKIAILIGFPAIALWLPSTAQ